MLNLMALSMPHFYKLHLAPHVSESAFGDVFQGGAMGGHRLADKSLGFHFLERCRGLLAAGAHVADGQARHFLRNERNEEASHYIL